MEEKALKHDFKRIKIINGGDQKASRLKEGMKERRRKKRSKDVRKGGSEGGGREGGKSVSALAKTVSLSRFHFSKYSSAI